jgi:hypothetical protein
MAAGGAYGVESVDGPYDRGQMYGGADGSFSGSGSGNFGGSATGGKGWGGLLKSVTKTATTLGKKGLKAAQVRKPLLVWLSEQAGTAWCWAHVDLQQWQHPEHDPAHAAL